MNRSLAAIAAGAMLLASAPTLGFAEEASSSSSSSSTSSVSSDASSSSVTSSSSSSATSSVSSESSSSLDGKKEWMRPCVELKGLLKAQCIVKHNPGKKNKKDRVERQNDDKVLNRAAKCEGKEGKEKVECLRKHGMKSLIKKAVKNEIKRTIRGKIRDGRSLSESSSESSED